MLLRVFWGIEQWILQTVNIFNESKKKEKKSNEHSAPNTKMGITAYTNVNRENKTIFKSGQIVTFIVKQKYTTWNGLFEAWPETIKKKKKKIKSSE